MGTERVAPWIENNLWAILCAVSTGAGGVLIGMTTTSSRLDALEKRAEKMETRFDQRAGFVDHKLTGRSDFMVCASRQIDRLNDKLGVTPPCQLEIPE